MQAHLYFRISIGNGRCYSNGSAFICDLVFLLHSSVFNFYFSVQLVFILYLLDVFYASGTLISIYFLFGRNCFQTNHIKIVIAVFNSYADYSSLNVRWKNPATVDSNR